MAAAVHMIAVVLVDAIAGPHAGLDLDFDLVVAGSAVVVAYAAAFHVVLAYLAVAENHG